MYGLPQARIRLPILIQVGRGQSTPLHMVQVSSIQQDHIRFKDPQGHPQSSTATEGGKVEGVEMHKGGGRSAKREKIETTSQSRPLHTVEE